VAAAPWEENTSIMQLYIFGGHGPFFGRCTGPGAYAILGMLYNDLHALPAVSHHGELDTRLAGQGVQDSV
jgi:hypothetical protein